MPNSDGSISKDVVETLKSEIERLAKERDALLAFKGWVHRWLDNVGVPHDPEPEQTKETGCRISGRMEWLMAHRPNAAIIYKADNPAT